jgi:hypothetical protein
MAEATGLPSLPQTVGLAGGGEIQGDPLEYMRAKAREYIEIVNKNPITKENEKVEFKKYVLKKLQTNIDKFEEIDNKYAQTQKEEEEKLAGEDEAASEEEDPFADIFGSEEQEPDEAMQEKIKLAQGFDDHIDLYKTKFLKKIRVRREKEAKQVEEKKMEQILKKLENV